MVSTATINALDATRSRAPRGARVPSSCEAAAARERDQRRVRALADSASSATNGAAARPARAPSRAPRAAVRSASTPPGRRAPPPPTIARGPSCLPAARSPRPLSSSRRPSPYGYPASPRDTLLPHVAMRLLPVSLRRRNLREVSLDVAQPFLQASNGRVSSARSPIQR